MQNHKWRKQSWASLRLRTRSVLMVSVLSTCALMCPVALSQDVAGAAALAAAIKSVTGDLRGLANDAAAAGDQVLHNRIEQAINGLASLLPKLEEVIKAGEKSGHEVVGDASRQTVSILADLHADSTNVGEFATAKLNLTLANASSLLNSIPFVNVPPAVFAVSPTRIEVDQKGRRLRIFGYLPGKENDDVKVLVDGTPVNVQRGAGGSLAFTLPSTMALKEEQEIGIGVQAVEHYGWFNALWTTHTFHDVVFVGKAQPFTCDIATYGENPTYLEEVKATIPSTYDATTQGGENRPNENRTINAADLFSATMGEASRLYDPKTVLIKDAGAVLTPYGGDSCGRGPGGTVKIAGGGKTVEIALNAPSLGRAVDSDHHLIPHITVCDAGGTHEHAALTPTFRAAKRDAQPLIVLKSESYKIGASGLDAKYPMPPAAPWSLHIKCAFHEGTETWSTRTMVLTPQISQDLARGLSTRLADDRLLIEPLNPIRFDDQLQ